MMLVTAMSKDMIIHHISVPQVMRVPVWSGAPTKRWLDERKSWGAECAPITTNQPSHIYVWCSHGGYCGAEVSLDRDGLKMIDDWHLHYGLCEAVCWAMLKMSR